MDKTKKILAVIISITIIISSCLSVSASGDAQPTIILSSVSGNAGDSIDVTVSLTDNPGIICMTLGVSYDNSVLELTGVTDAKTLSGANHDLNNLTANPYTLAWQNYSARSDYMTNGLIATLTFKIKDTAPDGTYKIDISYDNDNFDICNIDFGVVDFAVEAGYVTVGESDVDYVIDDSVTVFEGMLSYTPIASASGKEALITLQKGENALDALYVNKTTGVLEIDSGILTDKEGNPLAIGADEVLVAVVYNDLTSTLRYYVNETVPYCDGELANDILVSSAFSEATGNGKIVVTDCMTDCVIYNIGDSATAEIIAFQEHNDETAIRILSGVDMPWYGAIGFEAEVYTDGVGQGVESRSSDLIYESIFANGITVDASDYGHKYFATFEINEVCLSSDINYYIIVKPYTQVGSTKYYGTAARINVDSNGNYSFAE